MQPLRSAVAHPEMMNMSAKQDRMCSSADHHSLGRGGWENTENEGGVGRVVRGGFDYAIFIWIP